MVVAIVQLTREDDSPGVAASSVATSAPAASAAESPVDNGKASLGRVLLAVAFGTAVSSFIYEIAWVRMLSLVLGSATHSFELMLSAFILVSPWAHSGCASTPTRSAIRCARWPSRSGSWAPSPSPRCRCTCGAVSYTHLRAH